jgi:hypothetical protein
LLSIFSDVATYSMDVCQEPQKNGQMAKTAAATMNVDRAIAAIEKSF